MSNRGRPKARAALPPAPDDAHASVDAVDAIVERSGAKERANEERNVTTQKFVQQLVGASATALLPEDVERRYALDDAKALLLRVDAQSDTESESSEDERDSWWPLEPVQLSLAAANEVAGEAHKAEARGVIAKGTVARSSVLSENKVYLSAKLTRWRRAGTVLLAPPPRETRCRRCSDVAAGPMVNADDRLFCAPCGQMVEGFDRASIYGVDVRKQMEIDELVVMCCHGISAHAVGAALEWRMVPEGCKEVFRLADVGNHESTCDYALLRCGLPFESTNRAEKCHEVFPRRTIEEHRAKCEYRVAKCDDCEHFVQVRKMRAHSLICGSVEVFCPYRRCGWRGARDAAEAHVAVDCLEHPVMCRLEDSEWEEFCQDIVPRGRLAEHKVLCQFQIRQCEYCGRGVSLRRMGEHKVHGCRERAYKCERCKRTMPSEQREVHDTKSCPMLTTPCEYERFGCKTKSTQEEYRRHAEDAFHSHIELITFGPGGIADLVDTPRKDRIRAEELLTHMKTAQSNAMDEFNRFEDSCDRVVRKIQSRADVALTSVPSAGDVLHSAKEFKHRAAAARRQAERSLREKSAFDRDGEYQELLLSRNLAGAYVVNELRLLNDRALKLRSKSEALYAELDIRREKATSQLEEHVDGTIPDSLFVAAAAEEARRLVAEKREERRRLEDRLTDMKSSLLSAKTMMIDNIDHRTRAAENLERNLLASIRGVRESL